MLSAAHKLPEAAKIVIVIGIAYTLAATGWYLFSEPAPEAHGEVAGGSGEVRRENGAVIERIAASQLFGEADTEERDSEAPIEAPRTRLRLTLEGIFEADDPSRSAAIVAERDESGELYVIGDRLPGNATLEEVHSDRIILRRGGGFETLRFDEARASSAPAGDAPDRDDGEGSPGTAPPRPEAGGDEDEPARARPQGGEADRAGQGDARGAVLRETLEDYRGRLAEDPEGTLDELGVTAVAGDDAQGYRLGALARRPELQQAGLRSGDVVLSVNGEPVGDIDQDRDRLDVDDLLGEEAVRLEVRRGERRFTITSSLRQGQR